MATYAAHVERLTAAAASPSRRLIAFGGERDARAQATSTSVQVLALADLSKQAALAVDGAVGALLFAGDDLLLAGTSTGALVGWVTSDDTPTQIFTTTIADAAITGLACDAVGRSLAISLANGSLVLASISDDRRGVELGDTIPLSPRPLRVVAIDRAAKTVAASGEDGIVRTMALGGASIPREIAMPAAVYALAFTNDGRIACGCADGALRLCYLEGAADTEDRSRDAAHTAAIRGIVHGPELFDENNRRLPQRMYTVAEDGELKAWVLDTKRKPKTVSLGSALRAMAWAPASTTAKPETRGGTLVVAGWNRRGSLVTLNEKGEPDEKSERIDSRLAQLSEDLGARSDKVRSAAIDALAKLSEDEARKLLDRALGKDSKPDLRARAAKAIGESNRRLSRPALREALGDDKAIVRAAALAALSVIERDAPLAPARAALGAKHTDMRIEALSRLPQLRSVSPLVPTLIAGALTDSQAEVRVAALESLYTLEGANSLVPARIAMQRGPADVRQAVLLRLGRARQTRDPVAMQLLENALDDDDETVRGVAFVVSVASSAPLAAAIRAVDAHTKKVLDEVEASGAFADRVAVTALSDADKAMLFSALSCRHPDTALRAARCLALLGDGRASGALLQLSREPEAQIRLHVVEALWSGLSAMPGDDRLSARLEWLLDDPDSTVRNSAFDVLAKLGDSDGAEAAIDLAGLVLRCSQQDIRLRALPILVKFGGEGQFAAIADLSARATELLGDALDDEDEKVRGEAFRTLWAWNAATPAVVLAQAASSRHADIRKRVVRELAQHKHEENPWADGLALSLVGDAAASVGLAALELLTKSDKGAERVDVHLAAMTSPRPQVRAAGCKSAPRSAGKALRDPLIDLIKDERSAVHIPAIEALDRLIPDDAEGFALAFASVFYELQVRAMELCGVRRDKRAVAPATRVLTVAETDINRPSDAVRQRAARALADVGDADSLRFYVSLLDDTDGVVREMGARGLASACRPGDEQHLVDALAHEELPVRSWVAEGLARLGDDRALPVLAGTLRHDHLPIRKGAIMGFVALGPDGVRGLLQGLDDPLRDIQDLVFSIIVARDVALARGDHAPDLLLSALSSLHPEIRYSAARVLEERSASADLGELARELVGPRKPDKAADMKEWPAEEDRDKQLQVVVDALASDHPAHRYAAAQILTLRAQPIAFWRESARLAGPVSSRRPRIPFTSWDSAERQPRKKGWLRSLFRAAGAGASIDESATEKVLAILAQARTGRGDVEAFDQRSAQRLVFGTYAGLVRQAPPSGDADETHRVRRDSVGRLAALSSSEVVGRDAVMPVLRQALSDPHHLVRRASVAALRGLYPAGSLESLRLELQSSAADVGNGAVDQLIERAPDDAAAMALAKQTIDAPVAEVRKFALARLPRLFESGSLEPWLIALASQYADVRLSVVDRLVDSADDRVSEALGRAMESDHEDLRLKAAVALARRGDVRTVDVLGGLMHSEEHRVWHAAMEALVALAHARAQQDGADARRAAAAESIVGRLEDDPDETANRHALVDALGRIGSQAAGEMLIGLLADDDGQMRAKAFETLMSIARDRGAPTRRTKAGLERPTYDDGLALRYSAAAATSDDSGLRGSVASLLRDIDDRGAEAILAELVEDRDEAVRVAACRSLAFRAEHVEGASLDALVAVLRGGRRELVLPAAYGLASLGRAEAFQGLLLAFKAGTQEERQQAIMGLGTLGDERALEELEPLLDTKAELDDEDKVLAPDIVEALARMVPKLEDPDTHERVRGIVEDFAREGNVNLRCRALTGMRHAADERGVAFIHNIAADRYDDKDVRHHAIEELGKLAAAQSEHVLTDIVLEGDRGLTQGAIKALEQVFPDDRTRTNLIALRSPLADVSEPAAAYLSWHGDADMLVERMTAIDDDSVRGQLRQGLVRRGACPQEELGTLLTADELSPRADAAWIAGAAAESGLAESIAMAVRHSASAHAVASESADRTQQGRAEQAWWASMWAATRTGADAKAAAAAALAGTGIEAAPESVRLEALRYLSAHGGAGDLDKIEPSLSDPDPDVRVAAAAAVVALAPEQARRLLESVHVADSAAMAPIVRSLLANEADEMIAEAKHRRFALPLLLETGANEALIRAASSEGEGDDRLAAIAALGRADGDQVEQALEGILASDDQPEAVRKQTFKALRRVQRRALRLAKLEEASS